VEETEVGDKPNVDRYDNEDRAGRDSARAALCKRGQVVEEKLYGTELLSIGWT
jgi:hypothetical protein